MKKVKTAVWVLIVAFVVVLIYQNQGYFLAKQSLKLNLIFADYTSPEMENVYFSGMFFIAGLILGAYFLAVFSLKSKKKIKTLNTQVQEQSDTIATLEGELRALRGEPDPAQPSDVEPDAEPDAETVVINPEEGTPVPPKA